MKRPLLLLLALTGALLAPGLATAQYVYVTDDTSTGGISVIDTQTDAIQTVTSPDLFSPTGIALDTYGSSLTNPYYGDLFIANSGNDSIVTFDPGDDTFAPFASPIGLADPQGMTFDSSGNLYVTSTANNGSVLKYSGGTWSTYASSLGTPAGNGAPQGTSAPVGITVDQSGNLYVTEAITEKNSSVAYIIAEISKVDSLVTTSEYYPSSSAQSLSGAGGLTVNGSNLWVSQPLPVSTSASVSFIPIGGTVSSHLAVNAGLNDPQGVAFDAAGNLYVADFGDGEVSSYVNVGGGFYNESTTYSGSGLQNPDFLVADGNGVTSAGDPLALPVPEPGTWALLVGALAMLYFRQRWASLRF
jgi:serine/threonine-protein kinase